jgi:hypothetical protein
MRQLGKTVDECNFALAQELIQNVFRFQTGQDPGGIYPTKHWLIANTIFFSDIALRDRLILWLYGEAVPLTNNSYVIALNLSLTAWLYFCFPGGSPKESPYINIDHLVGEENTAKYIHRLKTEVNLDRRDQINLTNNDSLGRYCILLPASDMVFDLRRLANHNDSRIASPCASILTMIENLRNHHNDKEIAPQ